jgi:hypothetical protein
LAVLLAASAVALFGVTESNAACRQQFTNTTCSGIWPWQKCTNHFKTVCDAPATIRPGAQPQLGNVARPQTPALAGGRVIGNDGNSIISRDGAGIISRDGAGMRR